MWSNRPSSAVGPPGRRLDEAPGCSSWLQPFCNPNARSAVSLVGRLDGQRRLRLSPQAGTFFGISRDSVGPSVTITIR